MLDSTGNAQSNVQLRMYGLASLTNLVVSRQPAGVDSSTGTANNAAEQASQLFSQLDAGVNVLGDTTAYRYNYLSAGQVNQLLSFLNDLENLGLDVSLGQLESYRLNNYCVSLSLVVLALLQYARTNGSHLRTEARADNGSHQVTAECRTGHLQVAVLAVQSIDLSLRQSGSILQECSVLLYVYVEVGAVCGQTGVQTSCAARAEVTANVGSGDQQDLRLLSHNGVAQNLCISIGGVGLEQVALANQNLVSAVSAQFLCHLLAYALAAKQQAANFSAHVVCQLACLRDQLEYGRLQLALALLTEYPYAGEIGEVGVIKISHCSVLLSIR